LPKFAFGSLHKLFLEVPFVFLGRTLNCISISAPQHAASQQFCDGKHTSTCQCPVAFRKHVNTSFFFGLEDTYILRLWMPDLQPNKESSVLFVRVRRAGLVGRCVGTCHCFSGVTICHLLFSSAKWGSEDCQQLTQCFCFYILTRRRVT
jgi:hypothetical protein